MPYSFHSALLDIHAPDSLNGREKSLNPIEDYVEVNEVQIANHYSNDFGYWLYADFVMMYDLSEVNGYKQAYIPFCPVRFYVDGIDPNPFASSLLAQYGHNYSNSSSAPYVINNLNITPSNYSTATAIRDKIIIRGKVESSFYNPATITARESIDIEPGGEILPNIELKILNSDVYVPITGLEDVPPQSYQQIGDFCTAKYNPLVIKVASNEKSSAEIGEEDPKAPQTVLSSAYPNPTSNSTTIPYTLSKSTRVYLYLSDSKGTKLVDLLNGAIQESGQHEEVLDIQGLTAGVYFYTLQTADYKATKRLVILE